MIVMTREETTKLPGFSPHLNPWSRRIRCVDEYLLDRFDEVISELEEKFVGSILDAYQTIEIDERLIVAADKSLKAELRCVLQILRPEDWEDQLSFCLSQSGGFFWTKRALQLCFGQFKTCAAA